MDLLKNVSFRLALFLIGAIFVLLAISGGFILGDYNISVSETWLRILASALGVILIGFSLYLEIKLSAKEKPGPSNTTEVQKTVLASSGLRAQEFFFTLDDPRAENFPSMVKDTACVQILARTVVNLLSQYEKTFEELGKQGCEIRLLFVDPNCDVSHYIYGSNLEVYRNNILLTAQHLKRLKQSIGDHLHVRVIKHSPSLSIISVQKQEYTKSLMQIQLYFLHSAVGRDRPIFHVQYGDKWYKVFQDELNQLWSDSIDWEVDDFIASAKRIAAR